MGLGFLVTVKVSRRCLATAVFVAARPRQREQHKPALPRIQRCPYRTRASALWLLPDKSITGCDVLSHDTTPALPSARDRTPMRAAPLFLTRDRKLRRPVTGPIPAQVLRPLYRNCHSAGKGGLLALPQVGLGQCPWTIGARRGAVADKIRTVDARAQCAGDAPARVGCRLGFRRPGDAGRRTRAIPVQHRSRRAG